VSDPANQILPCICGWTIGTVCPERAKGCGCSTRCSGWRHRELAGGDGGPEDQIVERDKRVGEYNCRTRYGSACRGN